MSDSCGWFPMSREEIDDWVKAHRDDLPKNLAELSSYPIPFRKAILSAVAPNVRVDFWREHLLTFLQPSTDLAPDQQDLVRDAIEELPAIFGGTLKAGRARASVLEDRMRRLITPRQAREMFGTIGPPEPPGGLPLPSDAQPRSG
jgi:hypothetical protein